MSQYKELSGNNLYGSRERQSGAITEKERRIFVFCQEKIIFLKKKKGFPESAQNIKDSELIFVRIQDPGMDSVIPAYSD
ncbi:hypothetical protein CE91St56_21650 [Lachnospiraceae bacterium]|nr:hypothetical protein CE91St56_21650 [Lachnospiraceae bacterium]GKH41109.1 hypothetical protein CE91St57_20830 [Lachnospiraceae bacterium]